MDSLYDTSGIPACQAHGDCGTVISNFMNELKGIDSILYFVGLGVLYVGPGLIGVFWGAPLVTRELEAGTFRMTWNQSVTRTRWIAVKLVLVGLASMAAAGLLSLMMSWWASPINQANALNSTRNGSSSLNRLTPLLFGASGIAPVGYAAFAFALGVTAGVLIRRTLPAMAVTLAVFAVIQIVMPNCGPAAPHRAQRTPPGAQFRGHYRAVCRTERSHHRPGAVNMPGAWILSNQTITTAGRVYRPGPPVLQRPNFQTCQAALGRLHLRQTVTYQPASRYWALQWYETAIFLAAALSWPGSASGGSAAAGFPDRPTRSPPRAGSPAGCGPRQNGQVTDGRAGTDWRPSAPAGSGPSDCRRDLRRRPPSRRTHAGAARRT